MKICTYSKCLKFYGCADSTATMNLTPPVHIHTDQWIFGPFLASGYHNIWFYVLNLVSNYYGHRFLPSKIHKVELTFFAFEIEAPKMSGPLRRSQYFTLYPISLYDIEYICESKK